MFDNRENIFFLFFRFLVLLIDLVNYKVSYFSLKLYIINVPVNGYNGVNPQVIDNGSYKDYYEVKVTSLSKLPMKLQLPPDFTCDHCVFQWWYTAGRLHLTHSFLF